MNSKQLVEEVASRTGMQSSVVRQMMNIMADVVTEQLKQRNEVIMKNIGTFTTIDYAGSKGQNIHTGETIEVSDFIAPKLRASTVLKRALNQDVSAKTI